MIRDNVTVLENQNIRVRFDRDQIEDINKGKYSAVEALLIEFDNANIYSIGEEFCLSNYDMGCLLYNVHNDKSYILCLGDIDNILMQGKSLELSAHDPDEYERKEIMCELI